MYKQIKNIKIVVTKKNGDYIEIPLNETLISDLYDVFYMICPDCFGTFKLNNVEKSVVKLSEITAFIVHDVMGEGKMFSCKGELKKRFYMVKKPRWKSVTEKYKGRKKQG